MRALRDCCSRIAALTWNPELIGPSLNASLGHDVKCILINITTTTVLVHRGVDLRLVSLLSKTYFWCSENTRSLSNVFQWLHDDCVENRFETDSLRNKGSCFLKSHKSLQEDLKLAQ